MKEAQNFSSVGAQNVCFYKLKKFSVQGKTDSSSLYFLMVHGFAFNAWVSCENNWDFSFKPGNLFSQSAY